MGIFSTDDIKWTTNSYAYIPLDREADFVDGEGRTLGDSETTFWMRNSKRCPDGSYPWLEWKMYWCSFGPQDIPTCILATPPVKGTYPKEKVGSRPRGRNVNFNEHTKCGCQRHFLLKRCTSFLEIHYPKR